MAVTTAVLLVLSGLEAGAQTSDFSVEIGGSSVSPPLGIEGETARFFVAGVRGLRLNPEGSGILGSFLVGRTLESGSGGDFLSGTLEGLLRKSLGGPWSAGAEIRGFGFQVQDPFPYRSLGIEGGPSLRFTERYVSATLMGIAGGGWSETELQRTGRHPSELVKDGLWRYGASGEVLAGARGVLAGFALGIHESSGGTYRSAGLRLLAARGSAALELRLDAWETPAGTETTGGIAFILPMGGWTARGFLGRNEPDPLTLAEPGGGSGGVLIGRRLVGNDPMPPANPPLHRVLEYSEEGARVEIHVEPPRGTRQVEIIGDFTLWEPVHLVKDGTRWSVQIVVPTGIHHFGFLADGEWYLPEDAPDSVPDEWGRKNATIVIEGRHPVSSMENPEGTEGAAGK